MRSVPLPAVPVVSASSPEQLQENLVAPGLALTQERVARLNNAGARSGQAGSSRQGTE